MKKNLLPFLLLCNLSLTAQLQVKNLLTENLPNPVGIDQPQPRFSWQLVSDRRNVLQEAFELEVFAGETTLWHTSKTLSDQSVFVPYKGKPLEPGTMYHWRVRVWDNHGFSSDWSEPAFFQTAFLQASDWQARWIEPGLPKTPERPSPIFRKEFICPKNINRATVYVTAHGLYEARINGRRVGNDYLTPGWTSYNKRLQYQVYDVTDLLKQGANAIGVTLGNGWYRGNLAWENRKDIYGKELALLLQLEIEYADGKTTEVISDSSWKCATGEIQYAEIYHGETIDARLEQPGWQLPGFDDSSWQPVQEADFPKKHLLATRNEPIRKQETFQPKKIIITPKGETVLDFGQNLVGWVMVRAKGKSGDRIVLSHSEVLDKEGNFYTANLRAAQQQNTFILKDDQPAFFEPHFSWQGFRYVRIDEYPGEVIADDFTAVALYSDMRPTGHFESSDSLLNQLQHNIVWGQKGNFLDVPTDCPQRDERLGWTGDAQAFSSTAAFNFDVHNFFAKWLKDLAADQRADGWVPWVIPHVMGLKHGAAAGWADAATIIPWNMYLAYGDQKLLADQYESMKAWVDYMSANSQQFLWNTGFHFGDWLFYSVNDDRDGRSAITDKYYIAQCFYAYSTQLLVYAARELGKHQDEAHYTELLQNIKTAFLQEYFTPNGMAVSNTQTAYVLALQFDLLPVELRQQAADRLAKNIRQYNNHLTTGFLGTPHLCHVLSRFGYTDLAFELLMQKTYPSWLYPVTMGATTIWERWDGIKPDSTLQNPSMNSFNHYAYGAIGDWLYRVVAGIDMDERGFGYKKIKIKPHPGGELTKVNASLETPYGKIQSAWQVEDDQLRLEVSIPPNTTAKIYVPASSVEHIKENGKPVAGSNMWQVMDAGYGYFCLEAGSGAYQFVVENF